MVTDKQTYDNALAALYANGLGAFDLYAYSLALDAVNFLDDAREYGDQETTAAGVLANQMEPENELLDTLCTRALELGRVLLPRDFPSPSSDNASDERLLVTVQLMSGEQRRYIVPDSLAFVDLKAFIARENESPLRSIVDTAAMTINTRCDDAVYIK